jgi:hypothetical protein
VIVIAVKLLLAPCFVVSASLLARRYGVRVGGLIGGLPVVAGPILLVYALEHGRHFVAGAATGSLLGLVSLMGFVVVCGNVATRYSWRLAVPAGWAAFALGTLIFSAVSVSAPLALALVAVAMLAAPRLLPSAGRAPRVDGSPPSWDLPLRAACSVALVLVLTATASWLGPRVSGLLAPFPVIGSVLAAFTLAQRGRAQLLTLLRGLLLGYGGFALFSFTLATTAGSLGTAGAFLLATCAALLCQGVVLVVLRASSVVERSPASPGPVAAAETSAEA